MTEGFSYEATRRTPSPSRNGPIKLGSEKLELSHILLLEINVAYVAPLNNAVLKDVISKSDPNHFNPL